LIKQHIRKDEDGDEYLLVSTKYANRTVNKDRLGHVDGCDNFEVLYRERSLDALLGTRSKVEAFSNVKFDKKRLKRKGHDGE